MNVEKRQYSPISSLKDIFTRQAMHPLSVESINPQSLHENIVRNGFNLELDEQQLSSLEQTKFRNYSSDRGLAMSAVLGNRCSEFETLINQACASYTRSIKGDKTRGARQLAADLVSVSVGALNEEEFCDRINRRFRKSVDPYFEDKITGLPLSAAIAVIEFFAQ